MIARRRRQARWWQPGRLIVGFMIGLGLFWTGGFLWFAATLPPPRSLSDSFRVDGIVVLTGSGGRIRAGLEALDRGLADRMLISGVNEQVGKAQLIRQHPAYKNLLGCCVDLGHSARNTIGNAGETAFWAEQNAVRSILVITADYHMPRSLDAFRDGMPDVRLEPYAVPGHAGWTTLAGEYTKFMIAASIAAL